MVQAGWVLSLFCLRTRFSKDSVRMSYLFTLEVADLLYKVDDGCLEAGGIIFSENDFLFFF